jgi:hypothetical protein
MSIERNFIKRVNDIQESFLLISFIANIESHRNQPILNADNGMKFYVTQEMQCGLKAQFLIVLYNIVESTVCDCLNSFYDSIADDGLTFAELSDEMKAMWKNYLRRSSNPDYLKSDTELMGMVIHFEDLAINISGSLDIRKIFEVFSKHGCKLDETNRDKYSNSFLVVKNKRNNLAHGNISFSECGSNYMVSDLKKIKEDILDGMQEVVTQAKEYISNKKYKQI